MKTRTTFILSFTVILTLAAGSAFGKYSGGTGGTDDPYRIASASDLTALAADTGDLGKAFVLVNDIDLSGVTMTPIGNNVLSYTGVFDGNDHSIRNLVINTPGSYWIGLFGYLGPGGQVKNLGIVDANIHGAGQIGCLVGHSEGTITSCYATGVASGTNFVVGGLVGYVWDGSVSSSYAAVDINNTGNYAGGLAAVSYGDITNCYARGSVNGTTNVGGLVGFNGYTVDVYAEITYEGTITDCYSAGEVNGTTYYGGLVGFNQADDGVITASFWDTQTSGQDASAGGTGKTTAEMKTLSTFTSAGWDFVGETANGPNDTWTMPFAGGYPILSWQSIVTIGTGTSSWSLPLDSYYLYARTQSIYLASEIGGPRTLMSLALDVTSLPGQTLNNFTIRLKHTNLASYSANLWESAGWTTVYQSDETISATGWTTFTFSVPFSYNGTDNLMVDISFSNSTYTSDGECRYSQPGSNRTLYYSTDDSGSYSNPLTWSGSAPSSYSVSNLPNIRLGFTETSAVAVPLDFQVTKCTVTAGSKSNSDAISFSGTIDANADDFNDANKSSDVNFVKVTISDENAEDMDPCVFTFPVNSKTWKKGKFSSTISSKPLKMSFAFDTKKKTFSFSASNVDLTGLSCPVVVTIQIGSSSGSVSLDETIVNGPKKLIPYQLLMGAENWLAADKASLKRSSKPDANSLTVSGRFTTTSGPDLSNPMVITVGSQTFTVPGDKFLVKNGVVVSCSKAVSNEGPLVTAKLDYAKCTFTISVKNASITQTGVVDFGINCFGANLDGLETINLGP
jgi:The GLUG motif